MRYLKHIKISFNLFAILLIFTVLFALYSPTLKYGKVYYDDTALIFKNPSVKTLDKEHIKELFSISKERGSYRPVRDLSYALDYAIWGDKPFGYHFANVVIYFICSLLIYFFTIELLLRLTGQSDTKHKFISLLTSLIFVIHPVHVEAVAWISGRKEPLSAVFFFCALLTYLKAWDQNRIKFHYYILSLSLSILAMLTKPSTLILPGIIILYELIALNKISSGLYSRKFGFKMLAVLPFVAFSILFLWVNIDVNYDYNVFGTHYTGTVSHFVFICNIIFKYLYMLFAPLKLSPIYDYEFQLNVLNLQNILAVGTVLSLALLSLLFIKRQKIISFSLFGFFISLIPVLQTKYTGFVLADRYMFIPSYFIFLIFGCTIMAQPSTKFLRNFSNVSLNILRVSLCVLLILFLSFATIKQIKVWRDDKSLWFQAYKYFPDSLPVLHGMAKYFHRSGDYDKVRAYSNRALALDNSDPEALGLIGLSYYKEGDYKNAEKYLLYALEYANKYDYTLDEKRTYFTGLVKTYYKSNQITKAVNLGELLVNIYPKNFYSHFLLIKIYAKAGFEEKLKKETENIMRLFKDDVYKLYKSSQSKTLD